MWGKEGKEKNDKLPLLQDTLSLLGLALALLGREPLGRAVVVLLVVVDHRALCCGAVKLEQVPLQLHRALGVRELAARGGGACLGALVLARAHERAAVRARPVALGLARDLAAVHAVGQRRVPRPQTPAEPLAAHALHKALALARRPEHHLAHGHGRGVCRAPRLCSRTTALLALVLALPLGLLARGRGAGNKLLLLGHNHLHDAVLRPPPPRKHGIVVRVLALQHPAQERLDVSRRRGTERRPHILPQRVVVAQRQNARHHRALHKAGRHPACRAPALRQPLRLLGHPAPHVLRALPAVVSHPSFFPFLSHTRTHSFPSESH